MVVSTRRTPRKDDWLPETPIAESPSSSPKKRSSKQIKQPFALGPELALALWGAPALYGLLSSDVCCASSCGVCSDDAGCASRPGGRFSCCPQTIRATDRRCHFPEDESCAFTNWSERTSSATIAVGLYARSCADVEAFITACIGCDHSATKSIALIDEPGTTPTTTAGYTSWRCNGITFEIVSRSAWSSNSECGRCSVDDRYR